MPQSLSSALLRLVFSTRNRERWIRGPVESELHAYGTSVLQNAGCATLAFNGTEDRVHALFNLSRVRTIAGIVEELKKSTSKWIKTNAGYEGFFWQGGYAAFSVSASNADAVVQYIQNQKEHHRQRSFQEELRTLLERHKIAFDERYLWD
jgi:REP element-mobilizing transposase RayT